MHRERQHQVGAGGETAQVDLGKFRVQPGHLFAHGLLPVFQPGVDEVGGLRAMPGQQQGAHHVALGRQPVGDVHEGPGRVAQAVHQQQGLVRGRRRAHFERGVQGDFARHVRGLKAPLRAQALLRGLAVGLEVGPALWSGGRRWRRAGHGGTGSPP